MFVVGQIILPSNTSGLTLMIANTRELLVEFENCSLASRRLGLKRYISCTSLYFGIQKLPDCGEAFFTREIVSLYDIINKKNPINLCSIYNKLRVQI